MPIYNINYKTENHYENPVEKGYFELKILPQNNDIQKLTEYSFNCNIGGSSINVVELNKKSTPVYVNNLSPFKYFELEMNAQVEVAEYNPFELQSIHPATEWKEIDSMDYKVDNYLFLDDTAYTEVKDKVNRLNFVPEPNEVKNVIDYCIRCNNLVHNLLNYQDTDSIGNTIDIILNDKIGMCQDYAHLLISVLRYKGIASRYVSGYLNQGADYAGSAAMHAWVEVKIPHVGWVGLDPTNNLLTDLHYIKVTSGRDYNDCMPIKGVLRTTGKNTTKYSVQVTENQ